MKEVIKELRAMAARKVVRARQAGNATDALESCMKALAFEGFSPVITQDQGFVVLTVELSDGVSIPHCVRAEAEAADHADFGGCIYTPPNG